MLSLPPLFSSGIPEGVQHVLFMLQLHICICHSAKCNTTHTTRPILSQLVFQGGSRIRQVLLWPGVWDSCKSHHVEYYDPPLLSAPVRLVVIWWSWRGLTGAVWVYKPCWKLTRQACWRGESSSFSTQSGWSFRGWPCFHRIQFLTFKASGGIPLPALALITQDCLKRRPVG